MEDEADHHSHENGDSPESPYAKSRTGSGNSDNNNSHSHHNKEQDRFLPIANVGRIMKKVIPGNGKISKDAKETVQECVSEFISFVTGEASDRCQKDKRKTINGDDILAAIMILGFEDYVMPLKTYLLKYREIEGEKPTTVPKQRTHLQHQHPHQQLQQVKEEDIKPTNICFNNVYSSTNGYEMEPRDIKNLMPRPSSFLAADQPFSIPNFSPNSIHKQLQAQDQVDSVVHW